MPKLNLRNSVPHETSPPTGHEKGSLTDETRSCDKSGIAGSRNNTEASWRNQPKRFLRVGPGIGTPLSQRRQLTSTPSLVGERSRLPAPIGGELSGAVWQGRSLDSAGEKENRDDDEHDYQDAARSITPAPTVGPNREGTEQNENEQNQQE